MVHLNIGELYIGLTSMVVVASPNNHHNIVAAQGDCQQNQNPRDQKHPAPLILT